jgi:hypothetical protein
MSEETVYIGAFPVENIEVLEDGKFSVTLGGDFEGANPVVLPGATFNKISSKEQVEELRNINDLVIASATADVLSMFASEDYDLNLIQVESVARSLSNSIENKKNLFVQDFFGVGHSMLTPLARLEEELAKYR